MLTTGTLLLISGLRNRTIAEVLEGVFSPKPGGPGEGTVASSEPTGTAPRGTGKTPKGLTTFDGQRVCKWVALELQWAREHGWTGSLTSGYRDVAEQAQACRETTGPCAKPGESNHQGTRYPKCAADVTEPEQLDKVLSKNPLRRLHYTGKSIGDTPHFSSGLNGV